MSKLVANAARLRKIEKIHMTEAKKNEEALKAAISKKSNGCPVCGKKRRCSCKPEDIQAAKSAEEVLENKVVTIGDVAVTLIPENLTKTIMDIEQKSRYEQEKIVAASGREGAEELDSESLLSLARSFVQHAWYEHFKKEIPMAVKKNTEKRSKAATKKVASNGVTKSGEPRKARELETFRFSAKAKPEEFVKGQAAIVAKVLGKMKSGSSRDIVEACVKAGFKCNQPPERAIGWILSQWKGKGILVGA